MDHLIRRIHAHMDTDVSLYQGELTDDELKQLIAAYVKSINALEEYHYGSEKTNLESVLATFERIE